MPFSEAVTASLRAAAINSGIDLVVIDNKYDPDVALRNAEEFVGKGVDLVIEFQIDEHIAPLIGHTLSSAGIPVIAIDIPHHTQLILASIIFRSASRPANFWRNTQSINGKANRTGSLAWTLLRPDPSCRAGSREPSRAFVRVCRSFRRIAS